MAVGGAALRIWVTFLYALAFGASVVILGLYSYFLATTATHDVRGPNWVRAVEGISGAGVLYTIFALLLTCFLGGKTFFAFLAIVLNVLFAGGFIAIAIMARGGAGTCRGNVRTPLGNGPDASHTGWGGAIFTPTLRTVCRLNKAAFAVAIIGVFLFLLAAAFQILLGRRHQKDKKFGPSPSNNYTAGRSGRAGGFKFFKRNKKVHTERDIHDAAHKDAEAGVLGTHATHTNGTHAHGTHTHGTHTTEPYPSRYETPASSHVPTAGGYHSGPTGTAVNPYGYETKPTNAHY